MICLSEVSPLLGPLTPQPSLSTGELYVGLWVWTLQWNVRQHNGRHPPSNVLLRSHTGWDWLGLITTQSWQTHRLPLLSSLLSAGLLSPGYDQSNPTDSSQCPRPGRPENKVNLKIMVIFHFYLSAFISHQLVFSICICNSVPWSLGPSLLLFHTSLCWHLSNNVLNI